jgi:hypothetical protein
MNLEALGAAGGVSTVIYASVVEALPPLGKAIGGTAVAAIGASSAVKQWRAKKRDQKQQRQEGNDD